jgi:hypothetical protein
MKYRDQHKANGLTFMPVPRYMHYSFLFFSFLVRRPNKRGSKFEVVEAGVGESKEVRYKVPVQRLVTICVPVNLPLCNLIH